MEVIGSQIKGTQRKIIVHTELSPEILSRVVFWSILMKDQRQFTFFVHLFNHIKAFQTEVEWCCTTLPLYTETPDTFFT